MSLIFSTLKSNVYYNVHLRWNLSLATRKFPTPPPPPPLAIIRVIYFVETFLNVQETSISYQK